MNDIEAKSIKVNGLDVNYYTAGHGEPLLHYNRSYGRFVGR